MNVKQKHLGLYSAEFPLDACQPWKPCDLEPMQPMPDSVSKVQGQCHGTWTSAQGSSSSLAPPSPFSSPMKPPVKLPKWMPTMEGNWLPTLMTSADSLRTAQEVHSYHSRRDGRVKIFCTQGFGDLCVLELTGCWWSLHLSLWCCKYVTCSVLYNKK